MPKGPISHHKVTSAHVSPYKDHTLTLKFKLQSDKKDELDGPAIGQMLQHILQDWNDGRHPFSAEMVSAGLGRCLNDAFYNLIEKECQDEFGNEMVPHTNSQGEVNGETAKWCIEAEKRYAKRHRPWLNSEPEVEIT